MNLKIRHKVSVQGQEELPPNMPEPRGLGFMVRTKVDADHASYIVTRRSITGFLVWLNFSLIKISPRNRPVWRAADFYLSLWI